MSESETTIVYIWKSYNIQYQLQIISGKNIQRYEILHGYKPLTRKRNSFSAHRPMPLAPLSVFLSTCFCFSVLLFLVLLEDSTEYGSAFRLWANSESKLADTLNSVSTSLDKNCEHLKSLVNITII